MVSQLVDADLEAAATRFAVFRSRRCCCGKVLSDERSKVYGIGPECRRGISPDTLRRFVDAVARAHWLVEGTREPS